MRVIVKMAAKADLLVSENQALQVELSATRDSLNTKLAILNRQTSELKTANRNAKVAFWVSVGLFAVVAFLVFIIFKIKNFPG